MSNNGVEQVSIQHSDNSYTSHSFKAEAKDIQIDKRHTLADKIEEWDNKLDPVPGKILSDNDFTNKDKEKLDNIEEGAEVNIISNIQVNDDILPVVNKEVNIETIDFNLIAPKNHADKNIFYGVATKEKYGHVKFGDQEGLAIHGNDSRLTDSREPLPHASNTDAYGLATDSEYGHAKVVDITKNIEDDNAAVASTESVFKMMNSRGNSFEYDPDKNKLSLTFTRCFYGDNEFITEVKEIDSIENVYVNNKRFDIVYIKTYRDNEKDKIIELYRFNDDTENYEYVTSTIFSKEGNAFFLLSELGQYKYKIEGRENFEEKIFNVSSIIGGGGISYRDIRVDNAKIVQVSTKVEDWLFGKVILIKDNQKIQEKIFSNGYTEFKIYDSGVYQLQIDKINSVEINIEITQSTPTYLEVEMFKEQKNNIPLVSWSTGTDTEIVNMVKGYYNGDLSLSDIQSVWSLGDCRSVNLSAMTAANGVGESHRAQTIELQILDFNHDELFTPINGIEKALITVDQKNCLMDAACANGTSLPYQNTERGYMNSTNTTDVYWNRCARRNWCNGVYYNALPPYLKVLVKPVKKYCLVKSPSDFVEGESQEMQDHIGFSIDRCFLLSEDEVGDTAGQVLKSEGYIYNYYSLNPKNAEKKPFWDSAGEYGTYWIRSFWDNKTNIGFIKMRRDPNRVTTVSAYPSNTMDIAPAMCL